MRRRSLSCVPRAWSVTLIIFTFSMVAGVAVMAAPQESHGCCAGSTGDIDCDGASGPDVGDLTALLDHLYLSFTPLCCEEAANVDGSEDGIIDVGDVTALIGYMFREGSPLAVCPGGGPSDADKETAVASAIGKMNQLGTIALPAWNDSMVAFLRTQAMFDSVGIGPSGSSVFAWFSDGQPVIFANNLAPATDTVAAAFDAAVLPEREVSTTGGVTTTRRWNPGGAVASATAAKAGLPMSSGYRSLTTVGKYFGPIANTVSAMLSSKAYTSNGSSATVNALKTVGGSDGVFFIQTHGADSWLPDGSETYGLWTSTEFNAANQALLAADIAAGRLIAYTAYIDTNVAGVPTAAGHLAITASFIQYYWGHLPPNSLVFIDACGSDGATAQALKQAIIGKGAGAYFGWTHSVGADAANLVGKFMIDRMLGANQTMPKEDPAQRPFDYGSLYADLASRGLHVHPTSDTAALETRFTVTAGSGDLGPLAPSIEYMAVNEAQDELQINGLFGADPGPDGRVLISDVETEVLEWTPTSIRCRLPRSGPGSAGPVVVEVRASVGDITPLTFRPSNTANLTEWRAQIRYIREEEGTLRGLMNLNLHMRADLRPFREAPGQAPVATATVLFDAARDTDGDYSLTGTNSWSGITTTWEGQGPMPPVWDTTDPTGNYLFFGSVNTETKEMTIKIVAVKLNAATMTITTPEGSMTADINIGIDLLNIMDPNTGVPTLYLPLAEDYSILPGYREDVIGPTSPQPSWANVRLEWDFIPSAYPPDTEAPQVPPRF